MTKLTPTLSALLVVLAVSGPAAAQTDPFEAIVSNPDGANVALNDVGVPVRNPTESELRQYLEAFRVINLTANFMIDDGTRSGRSRSDFDVPVGNAQFGPFSVPNATRVHMQAKFDKRAGDGEAVLRTLEFVPSNPMALGPLVFNRMTMDSKGAIHLKLNLKLLKMNFWPQELTIEKIYKDRDGNLVFKMDGSGLAGAFVPDIRIRPDGTVQRFKRGFLGIGRGWKNFKVDGEVFKLDGTLPIDRWPPRATDIMDWLPQEGDPEEEPEPGVPPVLASIPVTEMNVGFRAVADPRRIEFSGGRGHVELSNHELAFDANGSFDGRTYRSDPTKPNGYRATATVTGELHDPATGSATIDRMNVELTGNHAEAIPFEDLDELELTASLTARADAAISNLDAGLPGGPRVRADNGASADVNATGTLVLRPLTENPADKKELTISRDSRFALDVEGPIELSGMSAMAPGIELPERMNLRAADDPTTPDVDESQGPVLSVDGDLGTKMGFVFARTNLDLHGETTGRGAVGVLNGEEAKDGVTMRSTLAPGAAVHVDGYAFAGIKKDTLEGGGVRMTTDARISGTATDTHLTGAGVTADLPGEVDLNARVAGNVRYGTRNGAETQVRSAAASASIEMREGTGTVEMGLPGGPVVTTTVGRGTGFAFDTGSLRRADPRGTALETEGYSRGENGAKLRARLAIVAGSVAHGNLAAAFDGGVTVDLGAAIGFRVDPAPAMAGRTDGVADEPTRMALDVGISFASGAALRISQGVQDDTVTFTGETRFVLHANAIVDASTGSPQLQALDGIDITIEANGLDMQTVLAPLGQTSGSSVDSRTTVRIKKAKVEFLEQGLRIHHQGIVFEIAPGTIEIGTRR